MKYGTSLLYISLLLTLCLLISLTAGACTTPLLREGPPRGASAPKPEIVIQTQKICTAIDSQNPTTRDYADQLARLYPKKNFTMQICCIYEHLQDDWQYAGDPRGNDYYASASQSISNGLIGDGDDFAILIAALIKTMDRETRIMLAEIPEGTHAYAELYIGEKGDEEIERGLEWATNRYSSTMNYHTDVDGKMWLNLDWAPGHPGEQFTTATKLWVIYPNGIYMQYRGKQ